MNGLPLRLDSRYGLSDDCGKQAMLARVRREGRKM